ncbi:MAG TPA: fibronectin type III domain-containing protein [Flavobacteriales bacterium]|nr:fibronectin type III domain-containing protein [Flavobacteriales bacterium]
MVTHTICKRTKHLTMAEMPLKARVILRAMTHNPHFPDAGPLLALLEERRAAMEAANVACLNGGALNTAIRKRCRQELEQVLDQLVGYVKMKSGGDVAIALSSGFQLRKPPVKLPPLEKPQNLRWVRSMTSGRVELRWDPMRGARNYMVYMNPDGEGNPDAWRMVGMSSRAKLVLHQLEPGQRCWFKLVGVSASGVSNFSQVVCALPC